MSSDNETRLQTIMRLSCEIAERQQQLRHLMVAAEQAGELRQVGVVVDLNRNEWSRLDNAR